MHTYTKTAVLWLVMCIAALQSGCATIVKGERQEIQIFTDPPGAECEVRRNGEVQALVEKTPGAVNVTRNATGLDVRCTLANHVPAQEHVTAQFNSVTFGNLLLGGLIGVAVDANSGANFDYATNVYLKLAPAQFQSAEQRDAYFEAWRAELLQDAQRAKSELSKQCTGQQCDQVAKRTDEQVQKVLARIDSTNAATAVAPVSTAASDAPATQSAIAKGAKWKYRMESKQQPLGTVTVEAVSVGTDEVTERVTREGQASFSATRDVAIGARPPHFAPVVVLPGGYQLAESVPYFRDDAPPKIGERWLEVSGEYFVPGFGKKSLPTEVAVVANEKVFVPAGQFDAIRIETQSVYFSHHAGNKLRVKCVYWYAPAVHRSVKMEITVLSDWISQGTKETYALQSFDPGR